MGKAIPATGCGGQWDYEMSRLALFYIISSQMVVRLSVKSRAIVWPEGLGQLKNQMVSLAIESVTLLM
jgi:hypothetical protein